MTPTVIPPALKFWRSFYAGAVVLASLAWIFWLVDTWMGHYVLLHTRDESHFLLVNMAIFPNVVSIWLMLRFFPPRQSSNMDYYVILWLVLNIGVSFLTGGVTALGGIVYHSSFEDVIPHGCVVVMLNLPLWMVLAFLMYWPFRKCRI